MKMRSSPKKPNSTLKPNSPSNMKMKDSFVRTTNFTVNSLKGKKPLTKLTCV